MALKFSLPKLKKNKAPEKESLEEPKPDASSSDEPSSDASSSGALLDHASKWKRWLLGSTIFSLVSVAAFLLGLQQQFPGNTLTRYIKLQLNNRFAVQAEMEALELGWFSLHTPYLKLSKNMTVNEEQQLMPLGVIENISLPWTKAILSQTLELSADAYEGTFLMQFGLTQGNPLSVQINNLQIDTIPALNLQSYAFLRGKVSLHSQLKSVAVPSNVLPEGSLHVTANDFQIQLKDLSQMEAIPADFRGMLQGLELPPLEFKEVQLKAIHGKVINIQTFELQGSLSGKVKGEITPRTRRPELSRAKLEIRLTLSEDLKKSLGALIFPLQAYMCENQILVEMTGTFARPRFKKLQCP